MKENIFFITIRYIAVEIVWDVIYFPIWWYTKGLQRAGSYCLGSASFHIRRRLALGIWLKSMFKPMYGDYTKEGRIISAGMRLVVLVWKLVFLVVWLAILFIIFLLWILLPPLVVYFILYQVFGVPLPFVI